MLDTGSPAPVMPFCLAKFSPPLSFCLLLESAVVLEEGSQSDVDGKETEPRPESQDLGEFEAVCTDHGAGEEKTGKAPRTYSRVRRLLARQDCM